MFLDCPAYLDQDGAVRCGLPAEVSCRFTMHSTDGPVESATIRCPAGHYFCGAIESLTWDRKDKHDPGPAAVTSAPGTTASRAATMAVTARTGSPSSISPPSRSRNSPAPTPLRPTIWATLPACGSLPCVHATAAPHPVTRCKPSPAARNRPHPGTTAPHRRRSRHRPRDLGRHGVAGHAGTLTPGSYRKPGRGDSPAVQIRALADRQAMR
jgi:hypothetical protein